MHEKNIRWGELVGGLLIVFCSGALVLSMWGQIADYWFAQVGVFMGVTGALFAAGLYAGHRWRLPHSSRGLLIIATVLLPLNFLLISALGDELSGLDVRLIGVEAAGLLLLGYLLHKASQMYVPVFATPLSVGVMASGAVQLVLHRLAGPGMGWWALTGLGAVPLAIYSATVVAALLQVRHWPALTAERGRALLTLIGLVSFAVAVTVGLFVHLAGEPRELALRLSTLLSLYGLPALAVGLYFWRAPAYRHLPWLRVTGTAVGIAGLAVMVAGIAFAWPEPAYLLPVLLVTGLVLIALALPGRLPEAIAPAGLLLMAAWQIGGLIAFDPQISWRIAQGAALFNAMASGLGGRLLVPAALVAGGVAVVAFHHRQIDRGKWLLVPAGVAAAVSLLLVGWHGFGRSGDPEWVAAIYGLYALVGLATAIILGRGWPAWVGAGLLTLAWLQAGLFFFQWSATDVVLGLAVLATGAALASWRLRGRTWAVFAGPALAGVWLGSLATCLLLVSELGPHAFGAAGHRLIILMLLWLALAFAGANRLLFNLAQAGLAGAAMCYVAAMSGAESLDIVLVQLMALALGVVVVLWAGLRCLMPMPDHPAVSSTNEASSWQYFNLNLREPGESGWVAIFARARQLVRPADRWRVDVEDVLVGLLVLMLVGLCWAGITPFVVDEWTRLGGAEANRLLAEAAEALGAASWGLLGLLAVVLMLHLHVGRQPMAVLVPTSLVLLLAATAPLMASWWIEQHAAASALRWGAAVFGLVGSVVVWLRQPIRRSIEGSCLVGNEARGILTDGQQVPIVRGLVLFFALVPVLLLSVLPAGRSLAGLEVAGPTSEAIFTRMGAMLAYAVPLAILTGTLIGHGVREQRGGYVFGGALVGNLTVSLGYLLHLIAIEQAVEPSQTIRLLQLNAVWSGLFTIAWAWGPQLLAKWTGGQGSRVHVNTRTEWLDRQAMIAGGFAVLFLAPAAGSLILLPHMESPLIGTAGQSWGWLAAALALTGLYATPGWWGQHGQTRWLGGAGVTAVLLLALTWGADDTATGYAVLMIGLVVIAWLGLPVMLGAARYQHDVQTVPTWVAPARRWVVVLAWLGVALALRGLLGELDWHGSAAWWAAGPMLGASGLMLMLASLSRVSRWRLAGLLGHPRPLLWMGLVLTNLPIAVLWGRDWGAGLDDERLWLAGLLAAQVLALLPAALASLVIDREEQLGETKDPHTDEDRWHPVHLTAAGLALAGVVAMIGVRLAGQALEPVGWLGLHVGALVAALLLAGACLWDRRGIYAAHALAALLLAGGILALDATRPGEAWVHWIAGLGLGGFALLGGALWASRWRWGPALRSAGVVAEPAGAYVWLISAVAVMGLVQAAVVTRIVLGMVEGPDEGMARTWWRISAALGPFLLSSGMALLAAGRGAGLLHQAALAGAALAAVLLGWAWTDPAGEYAHVVQYTSIALFALIIMIGAYGVGLYPRVAGASAWSIALRTSVRWLIPLTAILLLLTLLLEAGQYIVRGEVVLPMSTIVGVMLALIATAVVAIRWAIMPREDPFQLPERRRALYVYAAETVLALLFVHIRLSMPWLFTGLFEPYWPLIVMALAFAGTGLGAWFASQRMEVLASPLSRTALFLPLLPVLGFWMTQTQMHFSALLVLVGVFYGLMAAQRRSFLLGLAAAVAANGALWYLLHQADGMGLLNHPQLWLIPLGLSVLLAAYLNRSRLSTRQMGTIRYTCLSLIYLSSTAEIFLQGVAEAPWLPMVLAGLAVTGVMAGILLRVQSFLFTGCGFLVLALLTMLYHASAHLGWVWIWYVAGIGLGAAILFLFATFEHRKQHMRVGINRMRQWDV